MVLLAVLAMLVIFSGCLEKYNPQNEAPQATATGTPASGSTVVQNATLQSAQTVKCELCHTNAQDLSLHMNGGKLCINCHGSQVHSIHVGDGTVDLQCDFCHGNPPTVPKIDLGNGPGHYSICENCHAPPPNSRNPSEGNLILIHLKRSVYCTNCHGIDIGSTHEKAVIKSNK